MKAILRAGAVMFSLALLIHVFTLPAGAGCAPYPALKSGALQANHGVFVPMSFHLVSDGNVDPVIGFWKVSFSVQGQVIDSAFVQWHADGTEIMNSSRSPATQSFCLGVWERQNGRNYKLNHFALSFDPNGNFVGPANIREKITVADDGQTYSGNFTIDQYDTSGNVLAHVAGDITAFRITVNTPPSKIF